MDLSMAAARREFEAIAFGAVKDLLNKTGIQPRQIGIIITNSRCELAARWQLLLECTTLCSEGGQGLIKRCGRVARLMHVLCPGGAGPPWSAWNVVAHTVQH
jgi:hypothetical protein